MSKGVNKVILIGFLGKDPDVRYTSAGASIASVSIATSETWKDKETGERQERTEWHRVVFFNRLAEIAGEYLRKGQQVYIEGRLQTRKWQDQEGQDRYATDVVAGEMQMLGSRENTNSSVNSSSSGLSRQQSTGAARPQRPPQQGRSAPGNGNGSRPQPSYQPRPQAAVAGGDDPDWDDIPF